jgi:hypothetical protein
MSEAPEPWSTPQVIRPLDPPGTCHLVGCPGKGVHAPHGVPGGIGAPTQESWERQRREGEERALAARHAPIDVGVTRVFAAFPGDSWRQQALRDVVAVATGLARPLPVQCVGDCPADDQDGPGICTRWHARS